MKKFKRPLFLTLVSILCSAFFAFNLFVSEVSSQRKDEKVDRSASAPAAASGSGNAATMAATGRDVSRSFRVGITSSETVASGVQPHGKVDLNGDGRTDYVIARPSAAPGVASASSFKERLRGSKRDRLRNRAATSTESALAGSSPLQWWGLNSNDYGVFTAEWGDFMSDNPLTADFDGDGKDDIVVWRPLAGPGGSYFYSLDSSTFTFRGVNFGGEFDDPVVVGDYDGDGTDDPAVFRCPPVAPGQCYFYYRPSSISNPGDWAVAWGYGQEFDLLPFPGDFNGDGKYDFAVQQASPSNPSNAIFYTTINSTWEFSAAEWGLLNDTLISGDFDGDGKSDITVTRVDGSDALWWYVLERDGGTQFVSWGTGFDYQTPGDYDGDGRDDFAIYRENTSDATFWILPSNGNSSYGLTWGQPGDYPIANTFVQ